MNALPRTAALVVLAAGFAGCGEPPAPAGGVVRVGHFPNVTHAQALVAHAQTRAGKGWFEERLGPGAQVEWYTYNAGPAAMEALLAGTIDLAYVGPSPALNAYVKSGGADVRVVSGAARGGSALVVREGSGVEKAEDLRGRKVATPQLGNTQDVACRAWLASNGLKVSPAGGDVTILWPQNPDTLNGFLKGELDAAWTVEPWVSRLETEAKGRVLVEEKDALTTVLVASERFLRTRPAELARFVRAHEELTAWVAANPAPAQRLVLDEIAAETKARMRPELLDHAWPRLRFDAAVDPAWFRSFVGAAQAAGFLRDAGDLSRLVVRP